MLAKAIKQGVNGASVPQNARYIDMDTLLKGLRESNPLFNEEKFLSACGITE